MSHRRRGWQLTRKRTFQADRGVGTKTLWMSGCQTISKEARVAEGKSDRKQVQRKEILIVQTYNRMPYLTNNNKNAY